MKQRIFLFCSIFIFFIFIFIIAKICFTLINASIGGGVSFSDQLDILYNGLPLDMSMSGYLTALPVLLLIPSIWISPKILSKIYTVYFAIILFIISLVTISDIGIYPFWGFHFDSSIFLYLKKPAEAMASASILQMMLGVLGVAAFFIGTFYLYILVIRTQVRRLEVPKFRQEWKVALVLLLLTALLFLPIRGGVTVSTMNVGKVYYSDNMFYNHAAINPTFNLMYSLFKSDNFGSQYQFTDKETAQKIFEELNTHSTNDTIAIPQLLTNKRPNILLFMLESFSSNVVTDSLVAPNMCQYAKEGINFDNFFANSFRTDRGIVSILSGYPAHPTAPIIKYPAKTNSLPSIPKSLRKNGYDLSFYYGGDADFANMRSYIVGTCETSDICSDKDFPVSQRLTKWGVRDNFVLDKVYSDIVSKKHTEPFLATVLTLSSHEPFDVPTNKFDDPYKNSIAYTDSCIGDFINKLKETEYWDNTLVLFVADHAMQSFPTGYDNFDQQRYKVPLIWIGGAVKEARRISEYASQNDIAASLLSQLSINYSDFKFSKDVFNPTANKFAFYSYNNGFSMIDSTGYVIYDNDRNAVIRQEGQQKENNQLEQKAKAFFQNMYIDLGER